MLKVKIVSTSVRTAAWCRTQRNPSAMSWRMRLPRPGSRRCAGQHDAGHQHGAQGRPARPGSRTASAMPAAKSAAPIGGPASWLTVMKPVCSRELASARSSRWHQHRQQRARGVVREDLGGAEQEERHQHHRDRHRAGDDRRRSAAPARGAQQVDGDDDQPAVQAVGERAGVQAEQQRRQPLQQRGQRRPGTGRGSGRRPAAGRPRSRSRRRCWSARTTPAATGTRAPGVPERGFRRSCSQEEKASRREAAGQHLVHAGSSSRHVGRSHRPVVQRA